MSDWITEFAVIARHFPDGSVASMLASASCVLTYRQGLALFVCERDDGVLGSLNFDLGVSKAIVAAHNLIVPPLRLAPVISMMARTNGYHPN